MDEILTEYRLLVARVDRWFDRCLARFPDEITCGRGCSSCCRALFDITLLDAALLRSGYERLPEEVRTTLAEKALSRMEGLRRVWPEFAPPYLLNDYPEEEWSRAMPDGDETPCVLLGDDGLCLLYDYRPLTCRLHGLPMVDVTGQILHDEWCSLNFPGRDPLAERGLQGDFAEIIREETALLGRFSTLVTGVPTATLDTLIPAALLLDRSLYAAPPSP